MPPDEQCLRRTAPTGFGRAEADPPAAVRDPHSGSDRGRSAGDTPAEARTRRRRSPEAGLE